MNNKSKTILFASLIVAMILPFSGMNTATAEEQTWSFNKVELTNASAEGFWNNSLATFYLEYTGTQETCTISVEREYIDRNGLTKYWHMIAAMNNTVSFPCDTYPTFRMWVLPDQTVTMKINLTEEDGSYSELNVKDLTFSAVEKITKYPWILNDVFLVKDVFRPDSKSRVFFDLEYVQQEVFYPDYFNFFGDRYRGAIYCDITVDMLIDANSVGYPESMRGEYVRILDKHGFECRANTNMIHIDEIPNNFVTLKITLGESLERIGVDNPQSKFNVTPTVIELVDHFMFEKIPVTPWYFNGAVITSHDPELTRQQTFVKYDLDYTGTHERCAITLYKHYPEHGKFYNISDKHGFDCNTDPNIFTSVTPGDTGTYVLVLNEDSRDTIAQILLKDFTFELEQPPK